MFQRVKDVYQVGVAGHVAAVLLLIIVTGRHDALAQPYNTDTRDQDLSVSEIVARYGRRSFEGNSAIVTDERHHAPKPVATAQRPPAQQALTDCYVRNAVEMSKSTEAAPVVADAVMSLCSHLESSARNEIMQDSIAVLRQDGHTSYAQARSIVNSVEERMNVEWRGWNRNLLSATIIKFRLRKP